MTLPRWSPFGCDPECNGTLTVDSFSLNTPGWMVENLSSLWFEAEYRGTNRTLPRYPGQIGYPKRLEPYNFSLVFWVTGLFDGSGSPWSDYWEGLEENLEDLWDAVFSPVTSGDGARACTLTTPSGTNRTARVQFNPLRKNREIDNPELAEFVMTGTILGGRFLRP